MPSRFQVFSDTPGALRQHVRLLPGFSAADVDAIDHHAGHGLQHHPRIARRRQALQLVVGNAGRDGLAARIDDGGLRHDLHCLGHAAHTSVTLSGTLMPAATSISSA